MRFHPTIIGRPLILFVMSGFIGCWVSYQFALSWPLFLTLLGSVSLFFYLVNVPAPRQSIVKLVLIATAFAAYFVTQYAHFAYLAETGRLAQLGHLTSRFWPNLVFFTPQVNAVAAFLEGAFLLSLSLTRQASGRARWLWATATFLIGYGLLLTDSRGAWVGLAVGLLILDFRFWKSKIENLKSKIVIGLVLFFLLAYGLNSTAQTATSRLTLYRNSIYLLGDYPFTGIGLGETFALVYSRYQLLIPVPFLTYSHNLFLAVALGQGILGILAWLWLLISFYRYVWQVESAVFDTESPIFFRPAWSAVTATLIHGLFDAPQFSESHWTMPMLFALFGLTIAPVGQASCLSANDRQDACPTKSALIILIFLLPTSYFLLPTISGAWYSNWGAIYQTQADLTPDLSDSARQALNRQAIYYFEQAIQVQPTQRVAHRRLGLMALQQQDFITATYHLEIAYTQEPHNQATLKALGLAYLWTGQLTAAEPLLRQRDDLAEVIEELGTWQWWWGTQQRHDLAALAGEMAQRLRE